MGSESPADSCEWASSVSKGHTTSSNLDTLPTSVSHPHFHPPCKGDDTLFPSSLRLPPITKLFQKADDCERQRPPPALVPRFPGPLVVGHRRPASAQGHIGFHAPRPEAFQWTSDYTVVSSSPSPMMRERRPSSTPCLPTPPAFQSTFPSPPASTHDLPNETLKVSLITTVVRAPASVVRQQRRPAPYPLARGNNAPRWHKWWMAPHTGEAHPYAEIVNSDRHS